MVRTLGHVLVAVLAAATLLSPAATASTSLTETAAAGTQPAAASPLHWVRLGPAGGNFRSIAIDPQDPATIFAGTYTGHLYRSTDHGEHWSRLAVNGYWDHAIEEIVILHDRMIIGLWGLHGGGALLTSLDRGETWSKLHDGLAVRAIAIAPQQPEMVYVGSFDGVYRSNDGGRTLTQLQFPAVTPQVESLAVDPRDPQRIYAGTWRRAYFSSDGGDTWEPIHEGMALDSDVFSIAFSPTNPDVCYAGTCGYLYHSETGGKKWSKRKGGIPSEAKRIYAVLAASDQVVFAGTSKGLYMSTDGGGKFEEVRMHNVVVTDLAYDRKGGLLYAATQQGGIFRIDLATGDTRRVVKGLNQTSVRVVVEHPQYRGVVFAGVSPHGDYGGVYLTADRGEHWERLALPLLAEEVEALELVPAPDRRGEDLMLIGTIRGMTTFQGAGTYWRLGGVALEGRRVHAIARDCAGWVWIGTDKGLYRMLLDSAWHSPQIERVPLGAGDPPWITAIAVPERTPCGEPAHPAAGLLLGTRGGTLRVDDSGKASRVHHQVAYAFARTSGGILAGTTAGLHISRDGGATFEPADGNLPTGTVSLLRVHPDRPEVVVLGYAAGGGIWGTVDGGTRWRMLGDETLGLGAWAAAFAGAANSHLFVGTAGTGVWRTVWPTEAAAAAAPQPQSTTADTHEPLPPTGQPRALAAPQH